MRLVKGAETANITTRCSAQSCLILFDPLDCSPPGSSVQGIFQARILERVAISYSRGSSWPRDQTRASCTSCLAGGFFTSKPPGKPNMTIMNPVCRVGLQKAHIKTWVRRMDHKILPPYGHRDGLRKTLIFWNKSSIFAPNSKSSQISSYIWILLQFNKLILMFFKSSVTLFLGSVPCPEPQALLLLILKK